MSLKNNYLAELCMALLRTPPAAVPRFRDAWFTDDGKRIVILTRTGGNNRMDYVIENAKLRQLAGYYTDTDDGDDNTFAKFYYNIPVMFHEHTSVLATFMREMGMGEFEQGPGGIMRALDKSIRKQNKPPLAQRVKVEVALKELAKLLEEW
jgi:hypothetical protein